jgi:hypothetical protein
MRRLCSLIGDTRVDRNGRLTTCGIELSQATDKVV